MKKTPKNHFNTKKLKFREKVLAYVVEKRKPKLILTILLMVVLVAAMFIVSELETKAVDSNKKEIVASTKADDQFATISFAGDIMLGRNVEKRAEAVGYDRLFNTIQDSWEKSDFVMANLDTCVIEGDKAQYAESRLNKDIFVSTDRKNIEYIRKAGINVLSIATDHIADYGRATIKTAIDELDKNGIAYVGAGENRELAGEYQVLTVKIADKDIRIAVFGAMGNLSRMHGAKNPRTIDTALTWDDLVAGSESVVNYEELDPELLEQDETLLSDGVENDPWLSTAGTYSGKNPNLLMNIVEARQLSDVVVVYMHWGEDRMIYETDEMRDLAHSYIDAGADVVIGTNPRVVLPVEQYQRGIIFYSIGALVCDDAESRLCDSVLVDLIVDAKLNRKLVVTPVRINSCIPERTDNPLYVNRIFTKLTKKLDSNAYKIADNMITIELGQKRPTVIGG